MEFYGQYSEGEMRSEGEQEELKAKKTSLYKQKILDFSFIFAFLPLNFFLYDLFYKPFSTVDQDFHGALL